MPNKQEQTGPLTEPLRTVNHYYFFKDDNTFTSVECADDEEAVKKAKADKAVVRVKRPADSKIIYKLEDR